MPKIRVISECPRCHSIRTGIIQFDIEPIDKAVCHQAKMGCYIRQYSPREYNKYRITPNCFCSECNYEWIGTHAIKRVTNKEYNEYLKDRNLNADYFSLPSVKYAWLRKCLSNIWNAIRWR